MKAPSIRPVRCAIYTRVSTEYGLDQEFNSLDAQYDAASAYVKSQAHAGWTLIRPARGMEPTVRSARTQSAIGSDAARSPHLNSQFPSAGSSQFVLKFRPRGTEFLDAETGGQETAGETTIHRR